MCKEVPAPPPMRYRLPPPPSLKFQKRPAPGNYNSSKFISTPPILGRGLIPYIIVYLTEHASS